MKKRINKINSSAAFIPCKNFFSLRKFPKKHRSHHLSFVTIIVLQSQCHIPQPIHRDTSFQSNVMPCSQEATLYLELWKWALDTFLSPGQCCVFLHAFSCPSLLIILMAFTFPSHSLPKSIPAPCEGPHYWPWEPPNPLYSVLRPLQMQCRFRPPEASDWTYPVTFS